MQHTIIEFSFKNTADTSDYNEMELSILIPKRYTSLFHLIPIGFWQFFNFLDENYTMRFSPLPRLWELCTWIPHHAQLLGPIFVLFPPCVSLRGVLGVCIFQQSWLLEFECIQLTLDVWSPRNLHFAICS